MVEFDGVEIAYDGLQRFDLDLAYATTIHSGLGSEYPGVIIPIVSSHTICLVVILFIRPSQEVSHRSVSSAKSKHLKKHWPNTKKISDGLA